MTRSNIRLTGSNVLGVLWGTVHTYTCSKFPLVKFIVLQYKHKFLGKVNKNIYTMLI